MEPAYWNKAIETNSRERLEKQQLEDLKRTISQALKTPFYKKRLSDIGLESPEDIRSLDDFKRIPFTTKDDLRGAYPYGLLATDVIDRIPMVLRRHLPGRIG